MFGIKPGGVAGSIGFVGVGVRDQGCVWTRHAHEVTIGIVRIDDAASVRSVS